MIFATVGTHHQPFTRMLSALRSIDPAELVVQYGPGDPPAASVAKPYMPFDEMLHWFGTADRVISHAGVGSILLARRAGHVPIVFPRRHDLGEHVDDHQSELVEALAAHDAVIAVLDAAELPAALAAAPLRLPPRARADSPLGEAVGRALRGEPQRSDA